MPGYSGTPLPKKLGIKEAFRVTLVGLPADVKKTSGVATDMNENDVRRIGLEAGLVDVKVCAVSEVWSGLKFVRRVKDRKK